MSRESDDNFSINSTYSDLYQETVKRFTRSSLSPISDWDRYSPSRRSLKSTTTTSSMASGSAAKSTNHERRTSYDNYLEATGRRRSSDHGAVLTADTEQFIIGMRVWVGGIRSGQIAYIGDAHFSPGEWAGIVLDEPTGKNDGSVSGRRYFQCEPKRGVFSRLTRLTTVPLPNAPQTPTSPISKNSPERSRTVSPTASIRSSMLRSPGTGKHGLTVGDRVIVSSGFGSRPGLLRYLGETQFAPGNWCGVELDEPSGKNDGAVDGVRYFECKAKYGVFVPIAKVSLSPSSKKTRLSRTGSRESLTSIGTMNSIATTNTSRMRMNAQRKSSVSLRPVTATPKSQFSMQDLLREKQNHIEQLMIERDLDREDSQNQANQLQKNINELKSRVAHLEAKLADERKKTEELQFSVDEATFCGDELNAQTQVYKEKIHDLEKKLTNLVTATPSFQKSATAEDSTVALEATKAQIVELEDKLAQHVQLADARNAEQLDEEKRLQENIKYLQSQNELLQKELMQKDESLEKFSLSEVGIENLRRELTLLKEENDKQTQQANADFQLKLEEKQLELKRVTEELLQLRGSFDTAESERANMTDELGIMQIEIKSRDEQLSLQTQQLDELNVKLSVQQAENMALDEMIKSLQTNSAERATTLEEDLVKFKVENEQLKQNISELTKNREELVAQLKSFTEQQAQLQQHLKAASDAEVEKNKALEQFQAELERIKSEVVASSAENENLRKDLHEVNAAKTQSEQNEAKLQQQLEALSKTSEESNTLLVATNVQLEASKNELQTLKQKSNETIEAQTKAATELEAELDKLKEQLRLTGSQYSSSANEMSAKLAEVEAQAKQLTTQLAASEAALMEEKQQHSASQSKSEELRKELKQTVESLESNSRALEKLTQEHEAEKNANKTAEAQLKTSEETRAQRELELGDLTRKHEALNAKYKALTQQQETLQADVMTAHSNSAERQDVIRKLNEDLVTKQKLYAELESQSNVERLEKTNEIERLQQRIDSLEKDCAEQKQNLATTKDELSSKQAQITTLEEQTVKQELAISDASRQQANMQARYDELAQQKETLQQELTTMRTSSTDSNAELVKLSQEIVAKQKAYEELVEKSSNERATLESQLQAAQQRVDVLCSQVETLTQELKTVSEESFQRFEQLKLAEEQTGKQTLELSDLTRKLETLSTKCDNLQQENAKQQSELNATLSSNSDSNAKLLALNEKFAAKQKELEQQLEKQSTARLEFEHEIQMLKQALESNKAEVETLTVSLVKETEAKSLQLVEFEDLKAELNKKSLQELEETKLQQDAKQQKLVAEFEAKLQAAAEANNAQNALLNDLKQNLLQKTEELQHTKSDASAKEAAMQKQLTTLEMEKNKLNEDLKQLEHTRNALASSAESSKGELEVRLAQLTNELQTKEQALQEATSETAKLKLQVANASNDTTQLQQKLAEVEETLEITRTEIAHREQVAKEDSQKMEDLRKLLEIVQQSNTSISATNEELSIVVEQLKEDNLKLTHIYEIFEIENDESQANVLKQLTNVKQDLHEANKTLMEKEAAQTKITEQLQSTIAELENTKSALEQRESTGLEMATRYQELEQANKELKEAVEQNDVQLKTKSEEFDAQLAEYRKVIDEMDDAATAKTKKYETQDGRMKELEQALAHATEVAERAQLQCKNLTRKLESVELEKSREILALQTKMNGSAAAAAAVVGDGDEINDSLSQINFLNSIIADMQKKNDTLKSKIEAYEALPTDFTKNPFELITKRKPAPRVFCDICDVFDKHETEDCPLQASDSRTPSPSFNEANNNEAKKERKLPPPRKYCDSCEVFGHDTSECADDETF